MKADQFYNKSNGTGQNYEYKNCSGQCNNNASRGHYCNNTNYERLQEQQGQRRNNNLYPNSSVQSRFTSNTRINAQKIFHKINITLLQIVILFRIMKIPASHQSNQWKLEIFN